MSRVLVTPTLLLEGRWPYQDVLQEAGLECVLAEDPAALMEPDQLVAGLEGIEAIMASVEPFSGDVIAQTDLRVIARVGVGYDAVNVSAATQHNVAVTITPGTNQHSVAEQAIAMMVAVYRGFPWRDQCVRQGEWDRRYLKRLSGCKLGLLGLGRIGKAVVPRAQGLGLEVLAYDPYPDTEFAAANHVTLLSLDDVLAAADIVSLHLPATAETTDLINRDTLGRMKPGSVLINTSRGALVDEEAVADAIESGHLMAAGLDVFKVEPLPTDSRLTQLDRVLLSPHTGGVDEESIRDMSTLAAQCIADLYRGQWPDGCVVNDELREAWKW